MATGQEELQDECLYQLTLRFDAESHDQGNGKVEKPAAGGASS
jgi:hypothetical protein